MWKQQNLQGPNDGAGSDLGGNDRGDDFDLDDLDLDLEQDDLDDLDAELETDEEREEREAAEAKAEREKRIRIPKSRFDEEVGRARERAEQAEREAEELRAQLSGKQGQAQQGPSMEDVQDYIAGLEEQYEDLLIDGEKEDAREIRAKLNQAREYLADQKLQYATQSTQDRTLGSIKYEAALAQLESTFPQLNPNSDSYNDSLTNEVADLARTFMQAGQSNIAAIQRATKLILGDTAEPPSKARRREIPSLPGLPGQPRSTAMSGRTSVGGGLPIAKLTQEQFNKLDERTLSRARGDVL